MTSSRLLDTSTGLGAAAVPVAAYSTVHLQVTGRGGIPASRASAVVLNVRVTGPTRPGFVSVYADGTARSSASNLNFWEGLLGQGKQGRSCQVGSFRSHLPPTSRGSCQTGNTVVGIS